MSVDAEPIFLKELREQPAAVAATVADGRETVEAAASELANDTDRLVLTGCGDPYFAAQAAVYPIERWTRLPAEAVDALEFRVWRAEVVNERTLVVGISQSGKTIQVIESVRVAHERGARTLGVTNTPDGPLADLVDRLLLTAGGPSYSFPTRTTTTAAATLMSLALALAECRGVMTADEVSDHRGILGQVLPEKMESALDLEGDLLALAHAWQSQRHFAFIGSGPGFAAALIGAAKIKETCRLPAEADQLEEYGHLHVFGIQQGTPLVFLSPSVRTAARVKAMVDFALGRGHPIAIVCSAEAASSWRSLGAHVFALPEVDELFSPLLYAVPLQLLAYGLALTLGHNPDRPEGFDNVAIQKMIYTGLLEGWNDAE
jgi:glucosamine--fructose-6-phosphate aminotransferase (isomerizing)